uniref:Uncharacterized protein n=1 Tax=uncultured Desulfobacterium sp. TaxID=201089 RepID=E1YB05_9BACT|nr:unknown protein [uncultured Desulfobacterium sp.]
MRQRAGIEPRMGHLKREHQMDRNSLKAKELSQNNLYI